MGHPSHITPVTGYWSLVTSHRSSVIGHYIYLLIIPNTFYAKTDQLKIVSPIFPLYTHNHVSLFVSTRCVIFSVSVLDTLINRFLFTNRYCLLPYPTWYLPTLILLSFVPFHALASYVRLPSTASYIFPVIVAPW